MCCGQVFCQVLWTGVVIPVQMVVVNEGNTPLGQSPKDERTVDVYFSSSERKEEMKHFNAAAFWFVSHMTWIWIVTLPLCSAEHQPLHGRPLYHYTCLQVHHMTKLWNNCVLIQTKCCSKVKESFLWFLNIVHQIVTHGCGRPACSECRHHGHLRNKQEVLLAWSS